MIRQYTNKGVREVVMVVPEDEVKSGRYSKLQIHPYRVRSADEVFLAFFGPPTKELSHADHDLECQLVKGPRGVRL